MAKARESPTADSARCRPPARGCAVAALDSSSARRSAPAGPAAVARDGQVDRPLEADQRRKQAVARRDRANVDIEPVAVGLDVQPGASRSPSSIPNCKPTIARPARISASPSTLPGARRTADPRASSSRSIFNWPIWMSNLGRSGPCVRSCAAWAAARPEPGAIPAGRCGGCCRARPRAPSRP